LKANEKSSIYDRERVGKICPNDKDLETPPPPPPKKKNKQERVPTKCDYFLKITIF